MQLTSGLLGWERISRPSEELLTHSSSCLTKGETSSPNLAFQSHSPQHSGTFGGLGGVPCVLVEGEGCEVLNLLLCFSPRTTCRSRAPRPTVTTATAGWSWWTPSVRKRCSWDTSKSLKYDPPAAPLLQFHLYCLQIINKYIYIYYKYNLCVTLNYKKCFQLFFCPSELSAPFL